MEFIEKVHILITILADFLEFYKLQIAHMDYKWQVVSLQLLKCSNEETIKRQVHLLILYEGLVALSKVEIS